MLKNYFLVAWRNLRNNKIYSVINITGLAAGMAIALLIGLWIADELSFDHYAPNHSRVAVGMINNHLKNATKKEDFYTGGTVMDPLGKALSTGHKDLFTGVAMADFQNSSRLFSSGDKTVSGIAVTAQADLPSIFGFRMLEGNAGATKDPSTIIIARSLATALFGNSDPVGKNVKVDNTLDYHIGGVYTDLPKNTTFNGLQAILPWDNAANSYRRDNNNWGDHNSRLYVELAPDISAEQATERIKISCPLL